MALQEIRTSSGIGDVDVEELMLDIQEEMEATSLESFGVDAIGPEIDEKELNEEFRQLELECAMEKNVGESSVDKESVQRSVIEEVTGHKEVEAIQTPQKKQPLPLHG
ncbi:hypothetical protein HJC23_004393 [Cyclotella cryptica]|uniref:Uncharacterized protein n=1 Tax=Cyclotella cryptica TaxID=29204 RepID=A0ABD3PI30_9STRA